MTDRGSDFDITDTVQVSSPGAVCEAVHDIFRHSWPETDFRPLRQAFLDFERLFRGELPGFVGCDTIYHDMQHTLDMTLAMARLMAGHDATAASDQKLGGERAVLGLITALFHDSGYIREEDDERVENGAEYTLVHVTRSARFLTRYLKGIGLSGMAPVASMMVHFTGYEMDLEGIVMPDEGWYLTGYMLGTADLMAQMADRCYLEKCRDRLFPEFVLAGIAMQRLPDGSLNVMYRSGQDLLTKTPMFYESFVNKRLDGKFDRAYRFAEGFFEGENPYKDAVEENIAHVKRVISGEEWNLIRRHPECFIVGGEDTLNEARRLVADRLRELREALRSAA